MCLRSRDSVGELFDARLARSLAWEHMVDPNNVYKTTSLIGSVVLQCHVICFTWNGHRSNFASVLSAHYVSNFKSLALQDLIFWMCSVVWYFHAVTNSLNLLRHLVKPFITQASDLPLNQQKQWKYDSEPQFGSVLPYRNLGMVLGTTSRFDWAWGWHSVRERSGCKGFTVRSFW